MSRISRIGANVVLQSIIFISRLLFSPCLRASVVNSAFLR
jgi:hypothetical protein